MTRPAKSSRGQPLADLFASDAEAAVLRVLQKANAALTAGEVKAALRAGGVAKADADRAWPRVQKRIRWHENVTFAEEEQRYAWTVPPEPTPVDALDLIATGRLAAPRTATLVALVRAALERGDGGTRQRQAAADAVRTLAELAIEVEELTVNQASARAMIHRVRSRVKRLGLEPIDRAGEETTFDRKRHEPIGRAIDDGATVVVVRPGYVWKAPNEDVLVARAVVQDRS